MGLEFAPEIKLTDEGDGIMRAFSEPESNLSGSLILGFDPLQLAGHENPVYGLEVHFSKGYRPETPILLTAEDRSYLIEGISSNIGAVGYVKLALQKAIEDKQLS